jgi:hypothetical protein
MNILSIAVIIAGGWLVINGILHDVFVLLSEHGKVYNRELLRLLMDGHILITCGAILLFCYRPIEQNQQWACYIALIVCISLLVYCAMIFPFLRSIGTIVLSAALLILILIRLFRS